MSWFLLLVLGLVLVAEFVNGWTDAPNAIATVIGTRAMRPATAVLAAAALNFLGTLSGTAVATTIGKDIVDSAVVTPATIVAALTSLIVWSVLTAHYGIPTSESHALVAGLSGAVLAVAGPSALLWEGWRKVILGLACSTFLGAGVSFLLGRAIVRTCANLPATTSRVFSRLQILSALSMAYNHGLNDGQKFMGIFTLTLVIGGVLPSFAIPTWVIILCALTMAVGTSLGGWKIIQRIGMEMVDLQPWQGFAAETGASLTIAAASHLGIPLSTTHTIGTAIMGAGKARGNGGVNWSVARNVALAWILTFPLCGTLAFIVSLLLRSIGV